MFDKMYAGNVNGHDYIFYCEHANTRDGFKHNAVLYIDGVRVRSHTCYYYNRTWEAFSYQTACTAILRELMHQIADDARRAWMDSKGYKRLTANRRKEWENTPINSDELKQYQAILFDFTYKNREFSGLRDQAGARENAILDAWEKQSLYKIAFTKLLRAIAFAYFMRKKAFL